MGEVALRGLALDLEDGLRGERGGARGGAGRQARARRLEALRSLGSGVAHDSAT